MRSWLRRKKGGAVATKSLVITVRVDRAERAHNCRSRGGHRIERGEVRLKVRNGMGWIHFCRSCAENIIARDLEKLRALQFLTPEEAPDGD